MERIAKIKIERIAHDGAGESIYNGKKVRAYGMLSGEYGVVELRKKKGVYIGDLKELIGASSDRVLPHEAHYLSCSPWQIATYPFQAGQKLALLQELYGYYGDTPKASFLSADTLSHYRTKIEYSVMEVDTKLMLAFHERGMKARLIALPRGCMLASDAMNHAAFLTLEELERAGYKSSEIKTIVVRESKTSSDILVLVYLTVRESKPFRWERIPVQGGAILYSDPRSPASVATDVIERYSTDSLTESIGSIVLTYPWDGFFQNNMPMFARALQDIEGHIDPEDAIVDLYGGVGTIGITLARKTQSVVGAEISASMTKFAELNAKKNSISNYHSIAVPAEKLPDGTIANDSVLVVDPPRAGLHPKLLKTILEVRPRKIIYLSCNPETQARDYSVLKERYAIEFIRGYDFYPYTPHLESLIILNLR